MSFSVKRSTTLWWNYIDRKTLLIVLLLKAFGLILIAAASPASSARIGVPSLHFLHKQIIYMMISTSVLFFFSMLPKNIGKSIIYMLFFASFLVLILLPLLADEHKGAKRWMHIFGFCLQPSEFLKCSYIFIFAKLLEKQSDDDDVSVYILNQSINRYLLKIFIVIALHSVIIFLLLSQPDFGMALTICFITASQIFATGIPWKIIFTLVALLAGLCLIAIKMLPHVHSRVAAFLSQDDNLGYQIHKSLTSYQNGGFYGQGLGEGKLKYHLPDSHCDFIFAVAGEELGAIVCIIILTLFASMLHSGLSYAKKASTKHESLIIVGIHIWIAFQTMFNIGVTLNLLPTKGMTLPLISYGGSSTLALDMALGVYLSICRDINSIKNSKQKFHAKY